MDSMMGSSSMFPDAMGNRADRSQGKTASQLSRTEEKHEAAAH